MKYKHLAKSRQQQGVILVTSLFILLLMTIVGVTGMTTTSLEEKMTANLRDEYLAFQASEAALLEAEQFARGIIHLDDFTDAGVQGLYATPDPANPNRWETVNWYNDENLVITETDIEGLYEQPKYIIEHLTSISGNDSASNIMMEGYGGYASFEGANVYRITAHGTGGSANARVMLQSTFADN